MAEGQLNHFSDLGHLLSAATNIVITDFVQVVLFLISLDRFAFAVNDCILGNNAILWRIDLDHLELDLSHTTTNDEQITLADRPVGLTEVGCEKYVEERAGNTLYGIGDGENSDTLSLEWGSDTRDQSEDRRRSHIRI
jgi:hypothetical protein